MGMLHSVVRGRHRGIHAIKRHGADSLCIISLSLMLLFAIEPNCTNVWIISRSFPHVNINAPRCLSLCGTVCVEGLCGTLDSMSLAMPVSWIGATQQ